MRALEAIVSTESRPYKGRCFLAGIILAAMTEAIAGTVLAFGRDDIIGDTHSTPDEFAWLDVGYTSSKLIGFIVAAWLMRIFDPRRLVIGSTLILGTACAIAAMTARLDILYTLRAVQGFSGGILLVAGQAMIFLVYPRSRQPMLQATFAIGSVVAPTAVTPALQGWILDTGSWTWIFFLAVPVSLAAVGFLSSGRISTTAQADQQPFDWVGLSLVSVALICFVYVLGQGNRWDWFQAPRIIWLTVVGISALLAFLGQQLFVARGGLLDISLFQYPDFLFAFLVSFVAGAALFGSAYLIPAFAVSVLQFTLSEAGQLLLPSGALFISSLFIAAYLVQWLRLPQIATVPFGILSIMISMWMLSGSTSESGAADMMAAILLRGFGLGFLFLPITLIAFADLHSHNLPSGIGLFNVGRQLGGLLGIAGLQTLIDHNIAANSVVLASSVTAGVPAVDERLATLTAMLTSRGLDFAASSNGAMSMLSKLVARQSTVIAFDSAFNAIALLFVAAAPVLIAIKLTLSRRPKRLTR